MTSQLSSRLTLAAVVVVAALVGWATFRVGEALGIREGAAIAEAERDLTDAGWVEGSTDKPPALEEPIPDVAERDATIITKVEYRDRPVIITESGAVKEVPGDCPVTDQAWSLTPDDLALDIRTDVVRIAGKPFGITSGTIKARTPHGEVRRPFRTQDELTDTTLWAREQEPDAARFALGPRKLRHWRMGWSAGPALTYGPDGSVRAGVAVVWGVQF